MKRIRRIFVVGLLVGLAALTAVMPVLAAPGDGALVTREEFSQDLQLDLGWGLFEIKRVIRSTEVAGPSGVTNFIGHADHFFRVTEYGTGRTESIEFRDMLKYQTVDDVVRLVNDRFSTITVALDGNRSTVTLVFIKVDGRVVLSSFTVHN